jgi:hypothetical protein
MLPKKYKENSDVPDRPQSRRGNRHCDGGTLLTGGAMSQRHAPLRGADFGKVLPFRS